MVLPVSAQVKYWSIATVVFLLLLFVLGNVILPFLIGSAIAYFLDPVADRLQRLGLSRVAATALIAVMAVLVFILVALLVIPTLIQQGIALVDAAPGIFNQLQTVLTERFPELMDAQSPMRQTLASIGATIQERGGALINGLLSSALGVISALVFVVVVPVVAFYMLLDWDSIKSRIDGLLPRDHAPTIRRLGREIDAALAGFVRGQLSVCGILAVFYAMTLMLVGLQFGLVVGAITGLISFIPYVGAIIGGVLAIGLAMFQFWDQPIWIGAVVAIFVIGQTLEGNVLVPKLVGSSVGLHPVWLLFALSAFGSIFGFVGMLVAVPVAAALGVIFRFMVGHYTDSVLYKGEVAADPGAMTMTATRMVPVEVTVELKDSAARVPTEIVVKPAPRRAAAKAADKPTGKPSAPKA